MKGLLCFLCFFIFMIDVFFCTYLLGIKWGDHFFSKLLIAAVINYKFSQPNAYNTSCDILLISSTLLAVCRKLCLASITRVARIF